MKSLRSILGRLSLGILSAGLISASSLAQQNMYPQHMGKIKPFGWDPLPKWVTFDNEVRGRIENQTSLNYTDGKDRLYFLTRIRGGMSIAPKPWVLMYLQFQDSHALGLPNRDQASNMRDQFDLREGFIRLRWQKMQLIVGRQALRYGDERVVGISDWTNNSRTWDGFRLRIGDKNRVDIFSTSVVLTHPTSLDTHGAGLTFHGVEGSLTTLVPHTTLDPFVLVHTAPRVLGRTNTYGDEIEVTPGVHWDSDLPFRIDTSGTALLQRGRYGNNSIEAGAAIVRLGWHLPHVPWKSHLEGEFDYATGNSTDHTKVERYDQQYPSNHNAFGLVDLFGFQNIRQERINLAMQPRKNIALSVQTGFLSLASAHDGIYSSGGSQSFAAPTNGFTNTDLGKEIDFSAKHIWSESLVTNVGVGHLFPGESLANVHHHSSVTIAYLSLTYRFRVSKSENSRFEVEDLNKSHTHTPSSE